MKMYKFCYFFQFAEILSERFFHEKDKYHFVLITSESDYFNEYEEKFYKEKITEKEKRKMMYGLQTHIIKEINYKSVKNCLKKDKSKRLQTKLKEFENLKKLVNSLLKKNFTYISFSHGGFKEIHNQSIKLNIPLLNHDESCYLCRKNIKKTQNTQ